MPQKRVNYHQMSCGHKNGKLLANNELKIKFGYTRECKPKTHKHYIYDNKC